MTLQARITPLGPLTCQVVDGLAPGEKPALGVVLCHGFGAPANDLVSLAPGLAELQPALRSKVQFVFPGAPLSLEQYGSPMGRAWWHLPEAVLRGESRDWEAYASGIPEGLPAARRALMSAVDAYSAASGLGMNRIVLGGFSQGAMLTTDVALRTEESPAGLAILSGSIVAKADWVSRAAKRPALPVVQSHGTADGVLPFAMAESLRALLTDAGLKVEWVPFRGPHAIPAEALTALAAFLKARLP